ncbi:MAG TPA: TetR/AcrR family transcriptional regulator [Solirubrobacteraceae bacterium]|jgi:AcrR family transcriptional regulator|nr:TetR/AcrR family transcriptional regulator [Solirubrobacteraceae bacterium]
MSSQSAPAPRLPRSERREAILQAAGPLFAERAFDAISMTDVIRVAGVSRPIVYRHFPTTRDLVVGLIERHRTAIRDALAAHVDQHGPVADEASLRRLIEVLFARFDEDPAGWRLLAQDPSSDPRVAEVQRLGRDEIDKALARALGLPGRGRPRMLIAEAIRTAANGVYSWSQEHPAARRAERADALVAVIWNGIGSPAGGT